jgi:hypothetical protein
MSTNITPIAAAVNRKKAADAAKASKANVKKPAKIVNDSFKELEETFNATRLNWIIENFEKVCEVLRPSKEDPDHAQLLKQLRLYLACSYDYKREILYRQREGKGRYFATTYGLQGMPREIRGAICSEFYSDIDIVNCGPTILLNICSKNDIETPILADYVKDRSAFIKYSRFGLAEFKELVIKRLYGGGPWQYDDEPAQALSDEITYIQSEIKKVPKFKDAYNKLKDAAQDGNEDAEDEETLSLYGKANDGNNAIGKLINQLVFEAENQIMLKVYEFVGKPKNAVLCFDGIQLTNDIDYDLNEIADFVQNETGYVVNFKIKEMEDVIRFPYFETHYEYPRLEYANDYENVSGEGFTTSEQVLKVWINNAFAYVKNGKSPMIVEKQFDRDALNGQTTPSFVFKEWAPFKNSYKKLCRVINPFYDRKFKEEHERAGVDNPVRKDIKFKKYKFTNLADYLDDLSQKNKFKTYDKVDFIPYLKSKKPEIKGIFNLFTGFVCDEVEPCPEIDFEKSAMYKHIVNALCGADIDEANHLLDTIADMIQNPAEIKSIAHMFYTESGGGKGRFLDLLNKMIGSKNVVVISDMNRYLSSPFNALTASRLVRVFEELAKDGKHKGEMYDKLKEKIDAPREALEYKGIDPVEIYNFARVFIFTNNLRAMYIERTNRRFELHKGDNSNCDKPKYFAPIIEELKNPRFIKAAFDYFANRVITTDQRALYVNNYMRDMKNDSLDGPIKFLKYHIETSFASHNLHAEDAKPLDLATKKTFRVFQEDLISIYLEYGSKHLAGRVSGKGLTESFDEYEIPKGRADRGGKRLTTYILYPPTIEAIFKSKLRDQSYKFDYGADQEEDEIEDSNGDNIFDELIN